MKCIADRCWSPVACGAFGYCRQLNFRDGPQEFAVCMATDAFRLCLCGKPSNFSKREVIAWIEAAGREA